jgi:hypothetical protein
VTGFVRDVARLLLEPVTSYTFWLFVTLVLVASGVVLATIGERLLRPISVEVALRPGRVLLWMPLSIIAIPLAMTALILTIIGAGLAVILVLAIPVFVGVAYCAVGELVGVDVLRRSRDAAVHPAVAVAVGVTLLRLTKLVPFFGPLIQLLILWFLLAAVCAVLKDAAWSAYRRRLPDDVQFEGDGVVEWNPPAAAEDDQASS